VNFTNDVLKGKYFPLHDRNRLKATMINLLIIIGIVFFSFDFLESYGKGYPLMSMLEGSIVFLLFLLYVFFPRLLSLSQTIHITLFSIASFLVLSLAVKDINPEISLFWIATIPISFFYFLGTHKGIYWSFILFIILSLLTVLEMLGIINLLYNSGLMLQISVGYLVVSYWIYLIEKERSSYANSLAEALEGQEILFKEVHHRTKNNMQVIMGLLETQSFKIDDPKYKKLFQSHVERIKAMSIVHENLYKNEHYEKVDMHKYLEELCESLQKFTPHTIITEIDFVYLDIKISMSLGLILNEAVSNAIEHAYNTESGYIDVSLKCIENVCILQVKDYGKGLNDDKLSKNSSLGMTLIDDLSSSLPNGKMEVISEGGTEINVEFTIPKEIA